MSTPIANQPAFPVVNPGGSIVAKGLTAREYYAGLAMQGLLAHPDVIADCRRLKDKHGGHTCEYLAVASVEYADALLAALEEKK